MKYQKGTFITVPNKQILSGLDPQTQVLYMWLNQYANDEGECFPSVARLVKDCGMTKNTILDRLEKLVTLKLIKKQNQYVDNRQTTNLYTMELVGEGAGDEPPQCISCTPGGAGDGHRTQSIETQSKELGVSLETQPSSIKETNTDLSPGDRVIPTKKVITTDYDVVPVNGDGDIVSPRKKPQTWDVEKRVFEAFSSKAKVYTGVEPEPAKLWQLKQIRSVLPNFTKDEMLNLFDDWFNEAGDDKILSIHAALSAHNLNKYKMKK